MEHDQTAAAKPQSWSNWSGNVRCRPQSIASPHSEAELCEVLAHASATGKRVRIVGSGHSFVPLCATDEVLVTLQHLTGVLESNVPGRRATIRAGTVLAALGEPLHAAGLAMENMGDIDRQSIAGAISTGTHGTGRRLGNLSTQVIGLRIVLSSGEIMDCSPVLNARLFQAARLSLGTLGIISRVTLRLLPTYLLHERTWALPVDRCLESWEQLASENRHAEFFWAPQEDACAVKTLNESHGEAPRELAPAPDVSGRLGRYIGPERIDFSYRIFPSERSHRFNEMEYAVPADRGWACFLAVRELMQSQYPQVVWPIEFRTLAADDVYLSPAFGRDAVTISIHQAHDQPYHPFFDQAETIFRAHDGRPHWGKVHSLGRSELSELYPQWERFRSIRQEIDPGRTFMNDYLSGLFVE